MMSAPSIGALVIKYSMVKQEASRLGCGGRGGGIVNVGELNESEKWTSTTYSTVTVQYLLPFLPYVAYVRKEKRK